jgi:hypothetical protein
MACLVMEGERDCDWGGDSCRRWILERIPPGWSGLWPPPSEMAQSSARSSRRRERCSNEGREEPCSGGGNPEDRHPNCSVWSVTCPVFVDIMGLRGADSFGYRSRHAQNVPVVLVGDRGMRQLTITLAKSVGEYLLDGDRHVPGSARFEKAVLRQRPCVWSVQRCGRP